MAVSEGKTTATYFDPDRKANYNLFSDIIVSVAFSTMTQCYKTSNIFLKNRYIFYTKLAGSPRFVTWIRQLLQKMAVTRAN